MPRPAEPPRLYLRKDKSGGRVWIIRDRNRDRRTGCSERDREGAEKRLAEYLSEKHAARPGRGGRSDAVSLAEVMRVYALEHAPTTARPELIGEHIAGLADFWGGRKVSEIKGASCRKFAETRKPSMARRQLETLRAAVNFYHKEYGLDPLPAFSMPGKSQSRSRWLTRTEVAGLLRSARGMPHLRRFILIALYTGTRSGAVLKLSWLTATNTGYVDLEKAVLYRSGAGQRQTNKRQPPVAIPGRLLAHLKRWQRMDGQIRHVVQWNGASISRIHKSFDAACAKAGLDDKVVPHSLRHTCATWLMQAGVEIWQAAGFLGMSPQMVERTYGHHSSHYQKQATAAMDRRNGTTR
jgi:integrase